MLISTTLAEALDALAAQPAAMVLAGGTDAMVEINGGLSGLVKKDSGLANNTLNIEGTNTWSCGTLLLTFSPSRLTIVTCWPVLMRPLMMRPTPMRPT